MLVVHCVLCHRHCLTFTHPPLTWSILFIPSRTIPITNSFFFAIQHFVKPLPPELDTMGLTNFVGISISLFRLIGQYLCFVGTHCVEFSIRSCWQFDMQSNRCCTVSTCIKVYIKSGIFQLFHIYSQVKLICRHTSKLFIWNWILNRIFLLGHWLAIVTPV